MSQTHDIAVVGATGLVGRAMLHVLEQRQFDVGRLYPLASERSAGSAVRFAGRDWVVGDLAEFDFSRVSLALFSAGGGISERYVPRAAEHCVVIDNTSQFRYDDDVPLVVPEVNEHAIEQYKTRNIIANPNCSTIQMVVAVKPIYDHAGIERINVATYQSVSGAGRVASEELAGQMRRGLSGENIAAETPAIAFNAWPLIDELQPDGYTREEMKMDWETRKILEDDALHVNATAVRLPVFVGHSEAVHLETVRPLSAEKACDLLRDAPGVELVEPPAVPTALTHADGTDPVFVGRVRNDHSHPRGLNLWVVSDNLRKGAALNSVQIAEILVKNFL